MTQANTHEREALVRQYLETKNESLKESILVAYQNLVTFIARKLAFNTDDVPDLIQTGNMGLLKALETYDISRNIAFSTYASSTIIGDIRHYIRDKALIVKLPRKLQEQYSKIRHYIKEKTEEWDRAPTVPEIAKGLDLTEEAVLESMEAGQSFRVVSLDKPIQTSKSSNDTFSLMDNLGTGDKNDDMLTREMINNALTVLSEREKKLIQLRFYEGLTQKEIANRLAISQMHVSRLLNDALKKLRQKITMST